MRVRMVPWYIVGRLTQNMYRPQLHPSVCRGVLLRIMLGVLGCRSGSVMGSVEYHCLSVLWIMEMACGEL